jgi:nucleotide-binding universal stress UspA family protein
MSEHPRTPRLRLLVGVDLTKRSRSAFSRAVELARVGGGSLTLVHVTSDLLPPKLVDEHDSYARDVLGEHVLKAQAEGVSEVVQAIVYGRDYEQLIEQARKDQSDLIVVGRHQPASLVQDMLGTTVDRVLRLGGIPVLAVQHKAEARYNSVLVAVDFSPASRRALELAVRWFPQAHIVAVSAYGSPRRSLLADNATARRSVAETHRLALNGFLAEVGRALGPEHAAAVSRIVPVVEHGWAEDVILRAVEASKPDLLVVGTHARGGIGHAVLGSVAEWVLIEAPCDVLAVPPVRP